MQYQGLRSVSDNHMFVVCRDGEFYSLPKHVRRRGPWQGMHRGELSRLGPDYWLDLEEQGYSRAMRARGVQASRGVQA